MATVTVTMFGDKELEVDDSEVEVLRGQGLLTSVDGVPEEDIQQEADESILPPAELLSVGEEPDGGGGNGSPPADQQPAP